MNKQLNIRPFTAEDVPVLLELMKALACFEGYINDFRITEDILLSAGFGDQPTFSATVAEFDGTLVGYGVYYVIPFTYNMRPTVVMKELYVTESARGTGAGQALFNHIKLAANQMDAAHLKWLVHPTNQPAKTFYRKQGGQIDKDWEHWHLAL